jgi:murein DD-endopeptidase MepM/ murein hydrolase activator NlpD
MKAVRNAIWVLLLVAMGAVWTSQSFTPIRAQIIVEPAHISTPTPRPANSFLPTPTPTPTPATTPDVPAAASLAVHSNGNLTYIVKPRDTVWSVSLELGIDLADVPCTVGPHFRLDMPLVIGDSLSIIPAGMRCHEVAAGETLQSIAADYGVSVESITRHAWNGLAGPNDTLDAGRYLRIPPGGDSGEDGASYLTYLLDQPVNSSPFVGFAVGGPAAPLSQQGVPANWPYGSGYFIWPTSGWLSQGYRLDHRAVDIAAPMGSPVQAADRGVVIRAGWNSQGYGQFVVIDHNIDYMTLYAHLDEIFVTEGQVVGQGEVLGTVGSTGNSTGPHLHFEIRDFGRRVNPAELVLRAPDVP